MVVFSRNKTRFVDNLLLVYATRSCQALACRSHKVLKSLWCSLFATMLSFKDIGSEDAVETQMPSRSPICLVLRGQGVCEINDFIERAVISFEYFHLRSKGFLV